MTIETTLREMGFGLTTVLVCDDFNGRKGSHTFAVTVVKGGQSLQSPYMAGCGNRHYRNGKPIVMVYGNMTVEQRERNKRTKPDNPTLTDILSCFVMDAQCVGFGQTFEDFAGELGYDKDSRSAETTFNACRDIYFGLIRLVGTEGLDGLYKLFEDY